jgi:hypothetical protein
VEGCKTSENSRALAVNDDDEQNEEVTANSELDENSRVPSKPCVLGNKPDSEKVAVEPNDELKSINWEAE